MQACTSLQVCTAAVFTVLSVVHTRSVSQRKTFTKLTFSVLSHIQARPPTVFRVVVAPLGKKKNGTQIADGGQAGHPSSPTAPFIILMLPRVCGDENPPSLDSSESVD